MPPENGLSGGIDVCSFSSESLTGILSGWIAMRVAAQACADLPAVENLIKTRI
jgi:hypothetical protein